MQLHSMLKAAGDSASVMIELALVLPTLIVLMFGGIEAARLMRISHTVSALSREAANVTYRECRDKSGSDLVDCLGERVQKLKDLGERVAPQLEVVASLWVWNASPEQAALRVLPEPVGPDAERSRITLANFRNGPFNTDLGDLLEAQGALAFGEVRARVPAGVGSQAIARLFGFMDQIYAISVF